MAADQLLQQCQPRNQFETVTGDGAARDITLRRGLLAAVAEAIGGPTDAHAGPVSAETLLLTRAPTHLYEPGRLAGTLEADEGVGGDEGRLVGLLRLHQVQPLPEQQQLVRRHQRTVVDRHAGALYLGREQDMSGTTTRFWGCEKKMTPVAGGGTATDASTGSGDKSVG